VIERIGRRTAGLIEAAGRWGHFIADMARAVPDVATWGQFVFVQMRRIGVPMAQAESDRKGQAFVAVFREGLRNLGWTDGQIIVEEQQWQLQP